jgi:hypothetical protein
MPKGVLAMLAMLAMLANILGTRRAGILETLTDRPAAGPAIWVK